MTNRDKKHSDKKELTIYIAMFIILFIFYFIDQYQPEKIEISINSGDIIDVFPFKNGTGLENDIDKSVFFKQKEKGDYFVFELPMQNKLGNDRNANTDILTEYLKNNTFIFKLPRKIEGGYLYLKLSHKLEKNENVFINISKKISGRLVLEKDKNEFYIKLDDIKYLSYPEYSKTIPFNWIETMDYFNKNNYISMFYITQKEKHYIEKIIITYTY